MISLATNLDTKLDSDTGSCPKTSLSNLNVSFVSVDKWNRTEFRLNAQRVKLKTLILDSNIGKFSALCMRSRLRFFVVVLDANSYVRRAMGLTSIRKNAAAPVVINAGLCLSLDCRADDVFQGLWPQLGKILLHQETLALAPPPPRSAEAYCFEYSVLIPNAVKPLPEAGAGSRRLAAPIVPDIFLALAADPLRRLADVESSVRAQGLNRLDFRFMGIVVDESAKLHLPTNARRVIIDVGAAFLGDEPEFIPELRQDGALLVIAFEPLPLAYDRLIEWLQKQPPDIAERYWVLPLAAATDSGLRLLHQSGGTGQCSSLLSFNELALSVPNVQSDFCVEEVARVLVACIPLEEIIARLPQYVEIIVLKTDAQGLDLEVVRSAGAALNRIGALKVEMQDESSTPVATALRYVGQPRKQYMISELSSLGFALKNCTFTSIEIGEQDCFFERSHLHRYK